MGMIFIGIVGWQEVMLVSGWYYCFDNVSLRLVWLFCLCCGFVFEYVLYYYEEQWYEEYVEYGVDDYVVEYVGVDCLFGVGFGIGGDCQWYYVYVEGQ